jgi:hypothetical protein
MLARGAARAIADLRRKEMRILVAGASDKAQGTGLAIAQDSHASRVLAR